MLYLSLGGYRGIVVDLPEAVKQLPFLFSKGLSVRSLIIHSRLRGGVVDLELQEAIGVVEE